MKEREKFGSRLGFILVSAGCAVGLGNVWKFPYICGENGGAAFVLIYLVFLAILGFPIMCAEEAVKVLQGHLKNWRLKEVNGIISNGYR